MTSIRSCNRPVRSAARIRSITACRSDWLTRTRGHRAATCSRARRAICRTVAADFPTASAIFAWAFDVPEDQAFVDEYARLFRQRGVLFCRT